MTNTNEELGKRIEQLVVEHIAAIRKAILWLLYAGVRLLVGVLR